jgi:hypothetical protein
MLSHRRTTLLGGLEVVKIHSDLQPLAFSVLCVHVVHNVPFNTFQACYRVDTKDLLF